MLGHPANYYILGDIMTELLKRLLDLLPFNGKKTIISSIILALGILKLWKPEWALVDTIVEALKQLLDVVGSEAVAVGAGGLATGLAHKALKK